MTAYKALSMFPEKTDSNKPGILHVMWWEGVFSSGLMENQVYEPLRRMANAHPEYRWMLLSAGPFLKVGVRDRLLQKPAPAKWIRNAHIRNRLDTDALRRNLQNHNATLFFRETLFAPRTIYLRWPLQMIFPWPHLRKLARVIRQNNIRVVHCRSYSAAWVALLTRRWMRGSFRLVFDMRGLVPEEGVVAGAFARTGASFRKWKNKEKQLLDASDLVIAPSDTFAEHVATLTTNNRVRVLYTHSPVALFQETPADEAWYETHPAFMKRPMLAYLGALGPDGWHSVEYLCMQFAAFRRVVKDAMLLVVSRCDPEWLREEFARHGVADREYMLTATSDARATAGLLKLARYGALPYRAVQSPEEELIGRTMIASKTGEYLAAGLPLICHPGIGSAARMIEEAGVGCLYDEKAPPQHFEKALASVESGYDATQKRCFQAAERFDVQRNAGLCVKWYEELLSES